MGLVYFDITQVREIEQVTENVVYVTYLDGNTKKYFNADAQFILKAVKDFFNPVKLN